MAKSHLLPWLFLLAALCGPGTGESPQPLLTPLATPGPGVEGASRPPPPLTEPWLCPRHYPQAVPCPRFKDEGVLTQRNSRACPRSHSWRAL